MPVRFPEEPPAAPVPFTRRTRIPKPGANRDQKVPPLHPEHHCPSRPRQTQKNGAQRVGGSRKQPRSTISPWGCHRCRSQHHPSHRLCRPARVRASNAARRKGDQWEGSRLLRFTAQRGTSAPPTLGSEGPPGLPLPQPRRWGLRWPQGRLAAPWRGRGMNRHRR